MFGFSKKKGKEYTDLWRTEDSTEIEQSLEISLTKLGRGKDSSMAKTQCTLLLENIVEVSSIPDSRQMSETEFGRKFFESAQRMIDYGGSELQTIVNLNYNLHEYLRKRREVISNYKEQVEQLEDELQIVVEKPDKEIWAMRADLAEQEKSVELKAEVEVGKITEEECKEQLRAFRAHMKLQWNKEFLSKLDEYNAYVALEVNIKKQKKDIEKTQKAEVVVETLVQGYSNALTLISNRIKNAVSHSATVKTILQGIIELEQTKEVLSSPYEENNVSGMFQHLYETYHKANFVSFNNELIEVNQWGLTLSDSNYNPMKGVNDVQKMVGLWTKMGYFEYMTADIFWTSRLLAGYHMQSEIRTKAIVEVNQYLRKKELGEHEHESVSGELGQYPILRHLCEWIKLQHDSRKLKNPNRSVSMPQHDGIIEENLESAAVAMSSGKYASKQPEKYDSKSNEKLPKFVTRKMGIQITTDKGLTFNYTATTEQCKKCLEKNEDQHKLGCYLGQCNRCKLYGHTKANCKSILEAAQEKA